MKKKQQYEVPEVCVIASVPGEIVCSSPVPGGNEGVKYEDWNF